MTQNIITSLNHACSCCWWECVPLMLKFRKKMSTMSYLNQKKTRDDGATSCICGTDWRSCHLTSAVAYWLPVMRADLQISVHTVISPGFNPFFRRLKKSTWVTSAELFSVHSTIQNGLNQDSTHDPSQNTPSMNTPLVVVEDKKKTRIWVPDVRKQMATQFVDSMCITSDRVLRTRKQSGVRQILKVCKERVSAVNTRSQNSARNNSVDLFVLPINQPGDNLSFSSKAQIIVLPSSLGYINHLFVRLSGKNRQNCAECHSEKHAKLNGAGWFFFFSICWFLPTFICSLSIF